jgi:hypothetical protein
MLAGTLMVPHITPALGNEEIVLGSDIRQNWRTE